MKSVFQIVNSRQFSSSKSLSNLQSALKQNFYNSEQVALQESVKKLVEETINPHADQWDKDKIFPAKEVYKKFGEAGFLGIHRPTEYGGQGLSYKYNVAFIEALGYSKSAGAAMAIGVHTDCTTPALVNFGSEKLKQEHCCHEFFKLLNVQIVRKDQIAQFGILIWSFLWTEYQ